MIIKDLAKKIFELFVEDLYVWGEDFTMPDGKILRYYANFTERTSTSYHRFLLYDMSLSEPLICSKMANDVPLFEDYDAIEKCLKEMLTNY